MSKDTEGWDYAGTSRDKSVGSAVTEGPGQKQSDRKGGYVTGHGCGLSWKLWESPTGLFAIVPLCTAEGRNEWKDLEIHRRQKKKKEKLSPQN